MLLFMYFLHCSVNLMTCMIALATIAKQRPQFMDRVVMGFEVLHGMYVSFKIFLMFTQWLLLK